MKALSDDLRKRIVKSRKEGLTFSQIAEKHDVSTSAAHAICSRFEETGCYGAKPHPGKEPKLQNEYGNRLKEWIEAEPDITLSDLASRLEGEGKVVHVSTIKRVLDKRGFSYKKKRKLPLNESVRMSSDDDRSG